MTEDERRIYAEGVQRGRRVVRDHTRFGHPAPDYTMRTAQGHPPIPEQFRKPAPPREDYSI